MKVVRTTVLWLAMCNLALWAPVLLAQTSGSDNARVDVDVEEVVVTGTRSVGINSADLAVPIDVISADELQAHNSSDLLDVLTTLTPSYNVGREPISDVATVVRPASLRNLPADSTLILLNGKRRHKSGVIAEFATDLNSGAHAVDIAAIPTIALEQVEVLRDGASAQYGSDAIAGVINFRLSRDPNIRKIQAQIGSTYAGDGDNLAVSGIWGFSLGGSGYLTAALEYKQADQSNRGEDSALTAAVRAQNPNLGIVPEPHVWGTPKIVSDLKLVFNTGIEAGNGEIYSFGNFSAREIDGSFFYRNPLDRNNVYVKPREVPDADGKTKAIDKNGNGVLLVGDTMNPTSTCPRVTVTDYIINQAELTALEAIPNCFSFHETLSGGFTPRFVGEVTDTAIAFGYRGDNGSDAFRYDFSFGYGQSELKYFLNNTINASYGADTLRDFFIGAHQQSEILLNVDLVNTVSVGAYAPLNIAYGVQFLQEKYTVKPGQVESYMNGNPNLARQGFSVAANGFGGFRPEDSGSFQGSAISGYVDLEIEATERWLTSVALRYEDYNNFGDTFNFKFANRVRVTDTLNLRAAFSTGFRAPSSGQAGLQRISTTINSAGQLAEIQFLRSNSAAAANFGGAPLSPEKSFNASFGGVFNADYFELAVDYFNIKVDDRLTLVKVELDDAGKAFLRTLNPQSLVEEVSFFRNAVDTRVQGVDLTVKFPYEGDRQYGNISLLANWTSTKVGDVFQIEGSTKKLLRPEAINIIENGMPEIRFNVAWNHYVGDWSWLIRANYFDSITESLFNNHDDQFNTSDIVVVDAEVTWKLPISSADYKITLGVRNLFDSYLDRHSIVSSNMHGSGPDAGAPYPLSHSAGFNGGSFYGRFSVSF